MQAVGPLYSARAQANQYKAEAALASRQANDIDLIAGQASAARRESLNASLSTIENRRAGSGFNLDSPTAVAIRNEMIKQAHRAERNERVGYNNQAYATRYGGAAKRAAASNSLAAGYITAATNMADSAAKVFAAGG